MFWYISEYTGAWPSFPSLLVHVSSCIERTLGGVGGVGREGGILANNCNAHLADLPFTLANSYFLCCFLTWLGNTPSNSRLTCKSTNIITRLAISIPSNSYLGLCPARVVKLDAEPQGISPLPNSDWNTVDELTGRRVTRYWDHEPQAWCRMKARN